MMPNRFFRSKENLVLLGVKQGCPKTIKKKNHLCTWSACCILIIMLHLAWLNLCGTAMTTLTHLKGQHWKTVDGLASYCRLPQKRNLCFVVLHIHADSDIWQRSTTPPQSYLRLYRSAFPEIPWPNYKPLTKTIHTEIYCMQIIPLSFQRWSHQ